MGVLNVSCALTQLILTPKLSRYGSSGNDLGEELCPLPDEAQRKPGWRQAHWQNFGAVRAAFHRKTVCPPDWATFHPLLE